MGDAPTTIIEVDTLPALSPMLAKVGLRALPIPGVGGGRGPGDGLPDVSVVLRGAGMDRADDVDVAKLPLTAQWRVPKDIGRRYGRVSGDRNPIHLYGVTAKAFGFPRAIAHGMWTKARCLVALEGRLPEACTVDVAFKLPLLLPATVEYGTRQVGDGWAFGVRGRDGKPHLAGAVSSIR